MSIARELRAGYLQRGVQTMATSALLIVGTLAMLFPRYNDGCNQCHGAFTDATSPKGTIFPSGSKHEMHRAVAAMNTECDLCHTQGDQLNPYLASSNGTNNNPGVGCTGCHGRDYGGDIGNTAAGLRAHHAGAGVTFCSGCHDNDPEPLPEWVWPTYFGTPDTNVGDPCNEGPALLENWSIGDTLGLDNDGDGAYDVDDDDCDCPDADGDGVTICEGDCDDTNPAASPNALEVCDGIDNDCNGQVDEGFGTTFCFIPVCPHTIQNCVAGVAQTCYACVTLRDAAEFLTCFGPHPDGTPSACLLFDFDLDDDVDLPDYYRFLATLVDPQ